MNRNLTIDRLRGALVIFMVVGDYIAGIQFVPSFLKHAPDLGLTIADTVASAFVFVIGLNYAPSFRRRMPDGTMVAYRHFVLRYLAFIGIGAVIAGAANMVGQPTDWGVLQSIGVAGLICLLFIRTPTWVRFASGVLILSGYQFVLDTSLLSTVLQSVHGGFFGAISWGGLLVLSTAVGDIWRKGLIPYLICCASLIVAAGISLVLIPVSKHRVSLSFILITLAISAVAFLIADLLSRNSQKHAGLLSWWGQNALALYLVHLVVLGIFVMPPITWWYAEASSWLAVFQLVVILSFMSLVAWRINKRRQSKTR
ncbi:heparan-alpha-glucosaminide N-acetyltransferase domain-containing protein [Rhodoluna sp.]|uniref:heparan-alpha-glucosaminide N-acetyltransferase domain-containing protein n=1 Tax=Rhodoluna sp. TaxID=1969481 RepID=UPI0025F18C8A|nr:heparan-alpha-glucosaminide N-acetyltransferase domain-containing protein [Rhodoluna sp.]